MSWVARTIDTTRHPGLLLLPCRAAGDRSRPSSPAVTAAAAVIALGGDRRSIHIEAHRELILGLVGETPNVTIEELRRARRARHDRALRARRADQPPRLLDLRREGSRPQVALRRHRHHGQPLKPQRAWGPPKPAPRSAFCRPAAPTSTPSRWPSPSSGCCCEKSPSAPSKICGPQSEKPSKRSHPTNVKNHFNAAGHDPGQDRSSMKSRRRAGSRRRIAEVPGAPDFARGSMAGNSCRSDESSPPRFAG